MFVFLTEVLRRVLRAKREREIEELEIKFECEKRAKSWLLSLLIIFHNSISAHLYSVSQRFIRWAQRFVLIFLVFRRFGECDELGRRVRYIDNQFNLDLTYITDKWVLLWIADGCRIIAMGYPSRSLESLYRNNITDVVSRPGCMMFVGCKITG